MKLSKGVQIAIGARMYRDELPEALAKDGVILRLAKKANKEADDKAANQKSIDAKSEKIEEKREKKKREAAAANAKVFADALIPKKASEPEPEEKAVPDPKK